MNNLAFCFFIDLDAIKLPGDLRDLVQKRDTRALAREQKILRA